MIKLQHFYWNLLSAAALFGMVAIFLTGPVQSDDEDVKIKIKDDGDIKVKGEDGKVKIDADGETKVKGDAAEELATARAILNEQEAAEFKASLVEGYVVPEERYVYLEPLPESYATRIAPVADGLVYRYYGGTVYTVNPKTYAIVGVTTFDR